MMFVWIPYFYFIEFLAEALELFRKTGKQKPVSELIIILILIIWINY